MKTRLIAWEIFCAFIRYEVFKAYISEIPRSPLGAYFYGGAKFVASVQWRLFVWTCRFELIPFRRKLRQFCVNKAVSEYHALCYTARKDALLVLFVSQLKPVNTPHHTRCPFSIISFACLNCDGGCCSCPY
jgi:hypothetical protein